MVSPDNASRRELKGAVRQELKLDGTLAPEDDTFRVLVQPQDMTGAERSRSHHEVNGVVRYTPWQQPGLLVVKITCGGGSGFLHG